MVKEIQGSRMIQTNRDQLNSLESLTFHSRGVQVCPSSQNIHKRNSKNFTEISPDQFPRGTQRTDKICIDTYTKIFTNWLKFMRNIHGKDVSFTNNI